MENYRIHTLLLSLVGVNGDWRALLSAVVVSVTLSANVLKTLRRTSRHILGASTFFILHFSSLSPAAKTVALMVASHIIVTISGLILNAAQLNKVQAAREALKRGESPLDERGIDIVDVRLPRLLL